MSAVQPEASPGRPRSSDGRRPAPHIRRPRPERCLAGLRVVLGGRNRAGRLAGALEALRPAVERGAEVVYVDRGSRDGSRDLARRRFPFARVVTDPREALAAEDSDAPPPRFVAQVDLRAEPDWRCLRAIMRGAARAGAETLCAPALVGRDGHPTRPARPDSPPVWCGRAALARRLLAASGTGGRSEGAPVQAVAEVGGAPALLLEPAQDHGDAAALDADPTVHADPTAAAGAAPPSLPHAAGPRVSSGAGQRGSDVSGAEEGGRGALGLDLGEARP